MNETTMTSFTKADCGPAMDGQDFLDRTRSHRQILAPLNLSTESSSDQDITTDDEALPAQILAEGVDLDAVVGVSMGKSQLRLKSPTTPAVEKAKALEDSGHYFDVGNESTCTYDDDDRYQKPSDPSPERPTTANQPSSPRRFSGAVGQTPISTGHGSDDLQKPRRRAHSGSAAFLQSIRKILPDLPTPTLPKFPSSPLSMFTSQAPVDRPRTDSNASTKPQESMAKSVEPLGVTNGNGPESQQSRSRFGLDGNSSSSETTSRPRAIRRPTSDNSLYLRRTATGASDFDDTTLYASVGDMPNSRLKAISDSLQDSAIRLPRMTGSLRRSSLEAGRRSESNVTKQNTEANRRTIAFVPGTASTESSNTRAHQNTARKETKHPVLKEALSRTTGDLVIMGGYRGSVLRSAEAPHQQVWIPVKVGLNLRRVDLEVGLTHEDEERMPEKIIPSGILSHIGPIDISRRLLKKIRKCPQVRSNQLRVHDWGYDWRLSPHLLAGQLIKFLESLESNHPERSPEHRGAVVIAHSLGGLVTRHAINQRPELFGGVVFCGTPQNCVNILGPLRNGDDVLLSSRVLTAQVNFTLRTSFALLPENGRCFLNKETGERYDIDFFDAKTWDDLRLSPCINPPLPAALKRRSIVGSISESISSFAPSLPTKRSSWFSSYDASVSESIKEHADKVKDDVEKNLQTATERIPSPENTASQSLEPSMKSPNKPSIATTVTLPKEKAYEYLARTLSEIKQFKSELAHREDHQEANRYPPLAVIFGQGIPTVYGAKVASREAIKYSDAYDDLAFASGDGVVLASAAQLPAGYRCVKGGRVKSDRGHVGLLGDLEGIGQCIGAVIDGRRRGIGLGPEHTKTREWIVYPDRGWC